MFLASSRELNLQDYLRLQTGRGVVHLRDIPETAVPAAEVMKARKWYKYFSNWKSFRRLLAHCFKWSGFLGTCCWKSPHTSMNMIPITTPDNSVRTREEKLGMALMSHSQGFMTHRE